MTYHGLCRSPCRPILVVALSMLIQTATTLFWLIVALSWLLLCYALATVISNPS